ncbi:MAG: carboxypeptidase regulatory-like domain-containing protein [Patescibacteria group bacterium]
MAKKIMRHLRKRRHTYLFSVLTVAVAFGFYASFFWGGGAKALSGVVLTDPDTTGFGLDGRDFRVTWTPGDQPAGFLYTKIFITTSTASLATSTVESTGCGGVPCTSAGYFTQWSMTEQIVPQYMSSDSAGAAWSTSTQYVAWVFVSTTNPGLAILASSTPVSTTFDNISDVSAPQISHNPAHAATVGVAPVISAFVFDDQTSGQNFSNTGDGEAEYFSLMYATTTWYGANTSTAIAYAGEFEFYKFTLPTSTAATTFRYYLTARDRAGNIRFFCASPSAVSALDCQNNPFTVTGVTAGSRTVAGIITSNGANLGGAYVFADGYAKVAVTTAGDGTYTIAGLPDNDAFDFVAHKVGFCRSSRFETIGSSDKTGINLSIGSGSCGFYDPGAGGMGGGGGSSGGSPMVMFSGPPDGMQNVPINMGALRVGFNQPMDATTINDSDALNVGSNVYLTTDDGTTKVAGAVVYCASNASPGCSSLFSMDTNTILFSPSASLASSTFFTLVIGSGVKSQSGQSISGNLTGGGHKVSFSTSGGSLNMASFGTSGQFMPPYVKSMVPAPGLVAAPNTNIIVEFNSAMSTASMNSANIKLFNITSGANTEVSSGVTVSLDSNEQRFVTVSHSALSAGTYEVRVLGGAAGASGMSMRPPSYATDIAFKSSFIVSGSNDSTAPTIYPSIASGTTGVAVNKAFNFGFNETLSVSTVNNTNITLYRGATAVAADVKYDPGANSVFIVPNSALNPNTVYTIIFSAAVTDLASIPLVTTTYTYTTGGVDVIAPLFKEVRCDDYTCKIFFIEPMNHQTQVDSNWVSSTLNHARISITQGGPDKATASASITYDSVSLAATITGVGLTPVASGGSNVTVAVGGVSDLSGNTMGTSTIIGPVDDSKETFGAFDGGGMFAPPSTAFTGGTVGGGEFKPMGFGSFTVDQFAFGQAAMAFPFNASASQDSNVFQVKFTPGAVVVAGDKIELTFPSGTDVVNAALDTFSPFYTDFNNFSVGVVTGTAVSVNTTSLKVTVTLGVSGSPLANDSLTVDLRKITNPAIPKGPSTGGYTVGIKVTNAAGTTIKANKTSMPYFINAGGTNTLNVQVIAGTNTSTPTAGANGTVFMRGGGPGGPMDKSFTLTNGAISAIDGTSGTYVSYTSLPNGCYFLGTDPFVTLGGLDYFGQMSPEPICLNGNVSTTRYILLSSASGGGGSVTTTIKITGISNFNGADMDIFAGGPGKFVVKNLTGVTTTLAAGYTIKLPSNGRWFIGIGPGMPKGASASKPKALPGVPPSSVDVEVSGLGGGTPGLSRPTSMPLPPGVTFNDGTDTITFNFGTADKTVSGTVKDGSGNALSNIEVFMHRQGFSAPVFGTTNASGTFSLSVSDYGSYEIGAFKDGMPPSFKQVEVRTDGSDAGTDPDIYIDGKQVTGANPLILTLKKASYTISGKVLDSNSNAIASAPVFAINSSGNSAFGQTASDGSYSIYVDAGTWTVKAELPPSKSGDTCGSFSTTVTVTTESQSSQNITPSSATCYTLSGSVTVGSTNLANSPLFIEEWDSANSRPVAGGIKRGTVTDSNGAYSVKVLGSKTYRIGTLNSTYGELSATKAVATADATQNITVSTTSTINFVFTGGTSGMNAFVELKNESDKTKRVTKQVTGLNSTASLTVESGITYNYFIDVFGVGKFTGSVAAGATSTVNLGVSTNQFVTVTGTIYSSESTSTVLAGALVTFTNTSTGVVETASANASGTYSVNIKSGTYAVSTDIANYVPGEASQTATFSTTTVAYDFGGSSPDQSALIPTNRTIEGYVSSSSGGTITDGYAWATNASGTVVTAAIDSTGHYSLPVTDGTWTVEAVGPSSAETIKTGTVTVSGSNSTGNNFSLTSDSTRVPTSTSGVISSDSGGLINDSSASGIKLSAGEGVLQTTSGDVTINLEKTYTAPDTSGFDALSNATFQITATGDSSIKDLTGNAEIQIDYSSMVSQVPSGVSESDLKLMYYSSEKGDYVPVEGGFTVDATNNTITGQVDHFTDFVIAYVPPVVAAPAAAAAAASPAVSYGIPVPVSVKQTNTEPIKLPVELVVTPVETTKPAIIEAVVSNLASSVEITKVATASYQPGSTLKFVYQYQNETKSSLKVRIVRQLLDSKGKEVAKSTATRVLKPGKVFKASIKDVLSKKLQPGKYTERVRVYNVATNKLIDENSFKIMIEKLKVKKFILGRVLQPGANVDFVSSYLAAVKTIVGLPANFKMKYFYLNNNGKAHTVKMVRELVNGKGKVINSSSGKLTMAVGERKDAIFTQPVPASLAVGNFLVRIRVYDWDTKELLGENGLEFKIEMR